MENYTYNYLLLDTPITSITDDRLGRKPMVENIAAAILNRSKEAHNCYTIEVYGKWGEGKTSMLKMVCVQLSKKRNERKANKENRAKLSVEIDPYETCKDAHAVVILTEWDEFKTYDWQKIYDNMMKPAFVFDGRNILDKKKLMEIGFVYYSIGK